MKRTLFCIIILFPIYIFSQVQFTQLGQDIDGEAAGDRSGWSVSMNAAGDRVAIGALGNDGNGNGSGHARIYEWDGSSWIQLGQDIDGEAWGDESGFSVSMNAAGDRVAIGAPKNDGNGNGSGHARIYEWDGSSWIQLGQDIDGEAAEDGSGRSVSMNAAGDRVAIVALGNDGNGNGSGHARIYEWDGSSWIQLGQDIDGEAWGDESSVVSMNAAGDRVAIGAYGNNGNGLGAGHVRIFGWNGTSWIQQGQDIDGEAAYDQSGYSVSMNAVGDRVAIGAYGNDGNGNLSGHARIYAWNGTTWTQQGQDIDGEAAGDRSGWSVSMNAAGDRVAIGAYNNYGVNGNWSGHVRIYAWNGTSWIQLGQDIDGETWDDQSGWSVSMNALGDRVAIGAVRNYGNTGNVNDKRGHARIYFQCNTIHTQNLSACDSYTWIDGNTYTSSTNTPTYTLTNAAGCDSVVTLDLTINNSSSSTFNHIACDSYTWIDGNTYTSSTNTPTYTLTNAVGCDSVVTLNLTITNATGVDYQSHCDSYTWIDGNTYSTSTTSPTHMLQTSNGCDSLITLDLTILNSSSSTYSHSVCDSFTWIDGNTYTSSTNSPTITLTNAVGCDSVVTLDLTILNSSSSTYSHSVCDSYTWIDGNTYTSSTNSPTITLTNAVGCDSVVTLDLTITHATGVDYQTHCDSYTWIDGNTYTSSTNSPTYILTNTAGCDSTINLDLTVIDLNPDFNANQQAYLNPPFMVQFNNNTPNQSQYDYTWNFGDGNTLQSQNPVVTHIYQYNGLYDVTLYANDQITGCTDSLYQHEFIYCAGGVDNPNGIVEQHAGDVTIYPNPTADYITLEVNDYQGPIKVQIHDLNGKLVKEVNERNIDVTYLDSGVYSLQVNYGNKEMSLKLVKK